MNSNKKRIAIAGILFTGLFAIIICAFMLFPDNSDTDPQTPHTHTLSSWITEKAATCSQSGIEYKECISCKERVSTQIIEKSEHIEDDDWTMTEEPTCSKGSTRYVSCTLCHMVIKTEPVEPLPHEYGQWTVSVEPTCKSVGAKYRFCKICAISEHNSIEPLPHTYAKWTVESEPDCINYGLKSSVCSECKIEKIYEKVDALGHNYQNNSCQVCNMSKSSPGLEFTLNKDGMSYTMTGFGDCTDSEIIIDLYNDLPVTAINVTKKFIAVNATSIIVGSKIETISENSFSQLKLLEKITFTGKTKTIGAFAFNECNSLKEVYISDISSWCITDFGNEFANPMYYAKDVYVNGQLISDLEIPEDVFRIKKYAFYGAENLLSLKLPATLRSIEKYAFSNCVALNRLSFGTALTELGEYAFKNCTALTEVTLGEGLIKIGDGCFQKCSSLTSLIMPNSVTEIGARAFEKCEKLKTVRLSASLSAISEYMFYNCKAIEFIDIPTSVKTIGDYAFYGCTALESAKLGAGVNQIGGYAFMKCVNLKSINIPEGVTYLTSYVFGECTSLTTIIIPKSLTTVHNYAFKDCSSLKTLYFCGSSSDWKIFIGNYNDSFSGAKIYYYSATKPSDNGNYWYYDPILW